MADTEQPKPQPKGAPAALPETVNDESAGQQDNAGQRPEGLTGHNLAGRQLGRYQIVEEIGRGGMGQVYKVHDTELRRVVALKTMMFSGDNTREAERFLREARVTAALRHPHIVTLYDFGCIDGTHFFTMELLTGGSLQKWIKKETHSPKQTVEVMLQVVSAVEYAHAQGVIHRDLKPGNIMFDSLGAAKVMDFGLAKVAQASKRLSRTGHIIGTLEYMPPEQVEGRSSLIDERSDVYSLGAILYEMLTGRPPFANKGYASLLAQITTKDASVPTRVRRRVPRALEDICICCLHKEKASRYQSARELREDIERFLRGEPIKAPPARALRWRSILRRPALLTVCGVLAVAGAGAWSWWAAPAKNSGTRTPPKSPPVTPPKPADQPPALSPFSALLEFPDGAPRAHNLKLAYKAVVFQPNGVACLCVPGHSSLLLVFHLPENPGKVQLGIDHLATLLEGKAGYAPVHIMVNRQHVKSGYDPSSQSPVAPSYNDFVPDRFDITRYIVPGLNEVQVVLAETGRSNYWVRRVEIKNE